jgi:hypothetical protein
MSVNQSRMFFLLLVTRILANSPTASLKPAINAPFFSL